MSIGSEQCIHWGDVSIGGMCPLGGCAHVINVITEISVADKNECPQKTTFQAKLLTITDLSKIDLV